MPNYKYTDIFSDIFHTATKRQDNDYGFIKNDKNSKVDKSYFDNLDLNNPYTVTDDNSLTEKGTYERKEDGIYKDGVKTAFGKERKLQNGLAGFNMGTDILGGLFSERKKAFNYNDETMKNKVRLEDSQYQIAPYNPYGYNSSLQNNKTLYAESGLEYEGDEYDQEEESRYNENIYKPEEEDDESIGFSNLLEEYKTQMSFELGVNEEIQNMMLLTHLNNSVMFNTSDEDNTDKNDNTTRNVNSPVGTNYTNVGGVRNLAIPSYLSRISDDGDFLNDLSNVESRGDYKADNPDSSAVGKYQFLWKWWAPKIKKYTGVSSEEEYKNNPQAQEHFMKHINDSEYEGQARKLKTKYNSDLSPNKIKGLIHFQGYSDAEKYLASLNNK